MSKDYKKWKRDQMLPGGKVRTPTQCPTCGQVYHGKSCNTCGYTHPSKPLPPPTPQYGGSHLKWRASDTVPDVMNKVAIEIDRLNALIENLNTRIAELEGRYGGTCAECHKPAMADDYLCREHREAI